MKESLVEKKVSAYAKQLGWISFKFVSPSNRGVPDRIYIKNGSVVFVEFKAPGGKLRKLQEHVISTMLKSGAVVFVVDSVEQGMEVFDAI